MGMLIENVKFLSPPAETKVDLADEAASALTRLANVAIIYVRYV